jgi:hypothetical protein
MARQLAWSLCSQSPHDERMGRAPTLVLCSRNARPEKGLVRRAHVDQRGCPSQRGESKRAWKDQYDGDGRSMRAGETTPAALLNAGKELNLTLARRAHSRINQVVLEKISREGTDTHSGELIRTILEQRTRASLEGWEGAPTLVLCSRNRGGDGMERTRVVGNPSGQPRLARHGPWIRSRPQSKAEFTYR